MSQTKQDDRIDSFPATDERANAVPLVGYLGAAGCSELRRLYKDPDLELYIELRADDIVDESPAGEGRTEAETMIWVRPEASIVWHEPMLASRFAPTPSRFAGPRYPWPRP